MSSKPHAEGADRIVEILDRVSELDAGIDKLIPKVGLLDRMREERAALKDELSALLRSMDCESPGNFGWTGRVGWLMAAVADRMRHRAPRTDSGGKST